jgi:hypothetical protein
MLIGQSTTRPRKKRQQEEKERKENEEGRKGVGRKEGEKQGNAT